MIKRRNIRVKQLFDKIFSEDIGEEGGKELIERVISMELAVHAGSTLLAERESVEEIGGFDESMYLYNNIYNPNSNASTPGRSTFIPRHERRWAVPCPRDESGSGGDGS